MGEFDPTMRTTGASGSMRSSSRPAARQAPRSQMDSPFEVGADEQRDTAAQLLDHLADQALQYPPQNIQVLAASVQKFLLTNLEPALRMAQQLRDQAVESSGGGTLEILATHRQDQAMSLLDPAPLA